MRAKLRDVADAAGVSTATASLVLNNKADSIGTDAQQRVIAAARRLGYRPNALARSLRSQRTGTIGLLSHDVLTTPYAAAMIQGAQEVADELGYVLLLANVSDDPTHTAAGIDTLLDRQIDAAIYAAMFHRGVVVPRQLDRTPTVLLNAFPVTGPEDDEIEAATRMPSHWSVVPDEIAGATAAVERLVAAGHSRIGFVNEVHRPVAAVLRERSYRATMIRHGLMVDPSMEIAVWGTTHGAYPPVLAMLERNDRPSALFCFNDRVATGVYHAAHRLGLRIPEDLSVVGFDNQELIAEAVDPMLTTVQLPHYEMGKWAMQQIAQLLGGTPQRLTRDPNSPITNGDTEGETQKQAAQRGHIAAPQLPGPNSVDAPDEDTEPRIQLMPCPLVERQSVASPTIG